MSDILRHRYEVGRVAVTFRTHDSLSAELHLEHIRDYAEHGRPLSGLSDRDGVRLIRTA